MGGREHENYVNTTTCGYILSPNIPAGSKLTVDQATWCYLTGSTCTLGGQSRAAPTLSVEAVDAASSGPSRSLPSEVVVGAESDSGWSETASTTTSEGQRRNFVRSLHRQHLWCSRRRTALTAGRQLVVCIHTKPTRRVYVCMYVCA